MQDDDQRNDATYVTNVEWYVNEGTTFVQLAARSYL